MFKKYFLILPLFLASNIFERHEILVNSIGAYPEEHYAFFQIQLMIGLGFGLLLLLTIVQLVSYYFYNSKYHPFNKIVQKDKTCKLKLLNLLRSCSNFFCSLVPWKIWAITTIASIISWSFCFKLRRIWGNLILADIVRINCFCMSILHFDKLLSWLLLAPDELHRLGGFLKRIPVKDFPKKEMRSRHFLLLFS